MKETFNVEGMICSHYEERVRGLVSQISGVSNVNASAGTGVVEVDYTDSTSSRDIKNVIQNAGYDIV